MIISYWTLQREHIALHMSCQSVTFSFLLNNLRTPSSNLVHTSILGSRGTLLILGSLGQGHMFQNHFKLFK